MSSTDPPTQMRIHVGPSGDVEFSVSLTGSVDPSIVATMVAAVRAGIVNAPPPPPKPPVPAPRSPPSSLHSTEPSLLRNPPLHHQDPNSDPDQDTATPNGGFDFVESPDSTPMLSVQQIAARLDAAHADDHSFPHSSTPSDFTRYDHVREFASSPSLCLASTHHCVQQFSHQRPAVQPSQPPPLACTAPDAQKQQHLSCSFPAKRSIHPDRSESNQTLSYPFPTRPIRMQSLPAGSKYQSINDIYFAEPSSCIQVHAMPQPKSVSAFPARPPLLTPPQSRRLSDAHHDVTAHGSHRSTPRRDRVTAADVYDKGASSRSLRKRRSSEVDVSCPTFYDGEHERTDAPLSRYVQMSEGEEDFDAFENVEYVLTERYRDDPRASAVDPDVNTPKSGAWRLISSIGSPFTKRKTDADEDVYQSTLAMGQSRLQPNKAAGKGSRQLTFFGLRGTKNDDVWLEFSCSLPVERLLNEVGKITKSLGYQVWRRPSENKLRCIRQLNHRHEMHMVIFVGSIRLPEGIVSMVRLKRARGDRNRTPAWRYSNFYRELMERLQRNGIPVTSDS